MSAKTPALTWQGPLFERLYGDDNIAAWREVGGRTASGGGRIIDRLTKEGDAAQLAFVDLSPLPRFGVKGGEWDFLPKKCCPPINCLAQTKSGALVARLSEDELLCLPNEDGEGLPDAPAELILPRRDGYFCFGLCGAESPALLARLCMLPPPEAVHPPEAVYPPEAVHPPADGTLLQTIVGDIDGLLLPAVAPPQAVAGILPAFYWLGDSAYAVYAWQVLEETAAHLGGGALGWESWQKRDAGAAAD